MRMYKRFYIMWAAAGVLLASCVKDELYNTPHPDKGAVQITADWTKHSADALMPDLYVLRIGHEEQTVRRGEPAGSETTVFRSLFLPGVQSLLAYNPAEGFGIDGDIASVNTLADGTLHSPSRFPFLRSRRGGGVAGRYAESGIAHAATYPRAETYIETCLR